MPRPTLILALFLASAAASSSPPERAAAPAPPSIQSLVKPAVFQRAREEREILTHAELADEKRYSYYALMIARTGLAETRRVLTDYRLYPKMVPYIDQADFNPKTGILQVAGGIWKFRLASWVKFEERGDRWIHYRIIGGHFTGLEGDMFFEPEGEKGTLVYLRGAQEGSNWPPTFVIERGAEIVFGYTAKRMRSYLEDPTRK